MQVSYSEGVFSGAGRPPETAGDAAETDPGLDRALRRTEACDICSMLFCVLGWFLDL
jgi:hypothetical protein